MNVDNLDVAKIAEELLHGMDKPSRGKVVKLPTTYKMPGRGRKYCPECNNYVGVRTFVCDCGYEFPKGEHVEKKVIDTAYDDEPLSDEDKRYIRAIGCGNGGKIIHVGSGASPAQLRNVDYDSVRDYCEEVASTGISLGKIYMPRAIKCWARSFIGNREESIEHLHAMVDKWYDEKVASTMEMEI